MRWFWVDRFHEFIHGQRAVAVKNVSLAEDYLVHGMRGLAVFPASLIVEGMAQTGGLLVGETNQFTERVVLAKIAKAQFYGLAVPGDRLVYTAVLEDMQRDGAIVRGTVYIGERLLADLELVFAHLNERVAQEELFEPAEFLRLLRILGLYEVGRHADGSPLQIPEKYLKAERASAGLSGELAERD